MSSPRDSRTESTCIDRPSGPSLVSHALTDAPPTRPAFLYEPLDHATDSIRVLEIVSDPNESVIRCRMSHTTIVESSYRCLSYTWLPSHPVHEIEVNGGTLEVGDNLYQFLCRYRTWQRDDGQPTASGSDDDEFDKGLPLWIDAICIDQKTLKEKNHQVGLMGTIYKEAEDVIIWPGILDETLLDFLTMAQGLEPIMTYELPVEINPEGEMQQVFQDVPEANRPQINSQSLDLLRNGVVHFWSLPYWTRIWIVQEIILPDKNSELLIFIEKVPFKMAFIYRLLTGVKMMLSEDDWDVYPGEIYCNSRILRKTGLYAPGTCTTLPDLIGDFIKCSCMDKRDRVYALLSLAEEQPRIPVDYGLSARAVFCNVMEQYKDEKSIDELLLLGAQLIEGLELRCPRADREQYTPVQLCPERPYVDITKAPNETALPTNVSLPNWTNGKFEPYEMCCNEEAFSMLCIYVAVFDAEDVHVLEYAVEEYETAVRVRYARMHEFIQGQPKDRRYCGLLANMCKDMQNDFYIWLPMPSEDVYYHRLMNDTDQAAPALLRSWTGPKYCADFAPPLVRATEGHQYIGLAKRYWVEKFGLTSVSLRNRASIFPAAQDLPVDPAQSMVGCIGDKQVVYLGLPTVRGTYTCSDKSESKDRVKILGFELKQ
jgi:hypothetical protein